MNREILFRGKDLETGEWLYGSFVKTSNHVYISAGGEAFPKKVEPETVGQYTGLTDMNGNKIFEDDIIQSYHHREPMGVAVVYWQGSSFWCDLLSGSQFDGCNTLGEWDCECGIELIGNIFDNKDIVDAREWSSDGEWLGE